MSKEVSTLVLPASKSGTVVQSIKNAALWTFAQAFIGTFIGLATPVVALIQQDLQDAGAFDSSRLVLLGWFALSAIAGGVGALLSLIKNHFKTTLPAGEAVVAQAKP